MSHCILNTCSKVEMDNAMEIQEEENLRTQFLKRVLDSGIQLIQLPCPEFTLYGSNRWGHVSEQFDNPFFRNHCKSILEPFFQQLQEYINHPNRYHIMGFVGIDGSPSCGINYTCSGPWGGSMTQAEDWIQVINQCALKIGAGVFFDEIKKRLEVEKLTIPLYGLFASEPERLMSIFEE